MVMCNDDTEFDPLLPESGCLVPVIWLFWFFVGGLLAMLVKPILRGDI